VSHFTEVKTQIKDLKVLKQALAELGVQFEEADEGVEVMNFFGDKERFPMRIETGTKYAIGVSPNEDGSYELVADWDLLKAHKAEKLRSRILQRYSYCLIKSTFEAQGYNLGEEVMDKDGNLQVVVTQW
jgi:hypothetical protein